MAAALATPHDWDDATLDEWAQYAPLRAAVRQQRAAWAEEMRAAAEAAEAASAVRATAASTSARRWRRRSRAAPMGEEAAVRGVGELAWEDRPLRMRSPR